MCGVRRRDGRASWLIYFPSLCLNFFFFLQAKNALEHLNGFHLQERYIVVLYHMPAKQDAAAAKAELARREEELVQLKKKHNINEEDS